MAWAFLGESIVPIQIVGIVTVVASLTYLVLRAGSGQESNAAKADHLLP